MKRLRVYRKPLSITSSIVPDANSADIQYYDAELQEYIPDFRLIPFVFSLKASVTADKTISEVTTFIDTVVEEEITGVWTRKNSTSTFVIDVSLGSVKMYENTNKDTNRKFRMTAKVADPRNPSKYVTIIEQFTLVSEILAPSPFIIKESYPDGRSAHVLKKLDNYRLHAPLYRGQEEWFYTYYRWFIDKAGSWEELSDLNANGITGLNTPLLNVPFYDIPLEGLKIKVTADPVLDTSGINLISKKMISEDWNNIFAGTSTKEEDEDGKYFNINYVYLQQHIVERAKMNDIFLNRIKYKPNQQYILSVRWKLPEAINNSGLVFYVYYTDSTQSSISISKDQISLAYKKLITLKGKTIQKITASYGTGAFVKIYDIQLIECTDIANLFPESGILRTGTRIGIPLKNIMKIGKTYRYGFDYKCKSATTILILDNKDSKQHYGEMSLTHSTEFVRTYSDAFTITEGFSSSTASLSASTPIGNNTVELKNIFLCEGEKITEIWYPAEGEFIPAIPDGALKPDISNRAMTTTMSLTKIYPNPVNKEIVVSSDGNLPSIGSMFAGECSLTGNIGLIENPQNYYSCIWRKRPVSTGLWSELAKGFGIISTLDEEMDVDVVVEKGLQNAKYMACFDGVDNYSRITHSDFFTNSPFDKIYELDFILPPVINSFGYMFYFSKTSVGRVGVAISSLKSISIYVSPDIQYSIKTLLSDTFYRLYFELDENGLISTMKINSNDIIVQEEESPYPISSNNFYIGSWGSYFCNVFISGLKIKERATGDVLLHYDFQPTGGNRDNMLKNKNADGSINTQRPYDLAPVNIENLNDTNPETGFFRPTPAKTGLLNK